MAWSSDVVVSRDRKPVFPDRCVVCAAGTPGDTVRLKESAIRFWAFLGVWLWFWAAMDRVVIEAPACPPCSRDFRRERRWRSIVETLYFIVAFACAAFLLTSYEGVMKKTLIYWLAIVLVLPAIVWHMRNPLPFDITVTRRNVTYEFADPAYVSEFEKLNDTPGD